MSLYAPAVEARNDLSARHLWRDSPYRPTDWRWERARLSRENPRAAAALPKDADEWYRKARDFQAAHAKVSDLYDAIKLGKKWPNISQAYDIYENQVKYQRWELEARLLSRDSVETIGERLHLKEAVVAWYERLFFNVLDRLDNRGWIAHNVMGEILHAGATERDHELLWKLYGYIGGGHLLDVVIDKRIDIVRPEKPDDVKAFMGDEVQNMTSLKSMFAARLIPVNSYTQPAILEIYQRFQEIKAQAEGGKGDSITNVISINIQAMLENLPWTTGQKQPIMVSAKDPEKLVGHLPPPLVEADNLAAELRPDELYQIGLGEEPARLPAMRSITFRPKDEKGDGNGHKPDKQAI